MTPNAQIACAVRRALAIGALSIPAAFASASALAQESSTAQQNVSPAQQSSLTAQNASPAQQNAPAAQQTAPPSGVQQAQNAGQNAQVAEVVVTGTRIVTPSTSNVTSISPITSLSGDQFQTVGAASVEQLLNQLPQLFGSQTSAISNGGTGETTADLRNLGANRTLVLINGRRLMPGDPTAFNSGNDEADLNQIPAALIQRVDVLTGGASATYGADAVAGVVNFVMIDNFQGLRIDANAASYQHANYETGLQNLVTSSGFPVARGSTWDGGTKSMTVVFGTNFADDRGNITTYLGYLNVNPVLQNSRDFSSCQLGSGTVFSCSGSATAAPGLFIDNNGPTSPPGANEYTIGPHGSLLPATQEALFNYGPYNYYQRPDRRWTAGYFAHLDFSDHVTAYSEFMFMNDYTVGQLAPSGTFGYSFNVNCNNPYLSAAQVAAWCTADGIPLTGDASLTIARRNVEGGARQEDLTHTSFRGVFGARGEITDGWKYDVFGQYGRTNYSQLFLNDVSLAHLQNAFLVDPATGQCYASEATSPNSFEGAGCAPYNIFGTGTPSPAALAYIDTPGLQIGYTQEQIIEADANGDLGQYGGKLPTARDGIAVAVGADYREETDVLNTDEEFTTGDLAGQGGAVQSISGQYHVREAYGEVRVPVLQDMVAAHDLDLSAQYRYSNYSLGYSTNTYNLGLSWAPVKDVRFRYSYDRAVRAPTVVELYSPRSVQLDSTYSADPCSGATPTFTVAQCVNLGVPASAYGTITTNPAAQYNGLQGGNPNLSPETADERTVGVVFTPSFVPDLTASVDYYNIYIKGLVNTIGASYIVAQCGLTGNPTYCDLVHRVPSNNYSLWLGTAGYVVDTLENTGFGQEKGFDFNISYKHALPDPYGGLSFAFTGTYLDSFLYSPNPGTPAYDCAGLYGPTCSSTIANGPLPKFRSRTQVDWLTPYRDLDVTLVWRHISPVDIDASSSNPFLQSTGPLYPSVPSYYPTDASLGSRDYFDLSLSMPILEKAVLTVGCNNILDKDPPLTGLAASVGVFYNGNTFPAIYDTLGRYIFANVRINL